MRQQRQQQPAGWFQRQFTTGMWVALIGLIVWAAGSEFGGMIVFGGVLYALLGRLFTGVYEETRRRYPWRL